MGAGDPLYRAAHLELEHWNSIPNDSSVRGSYNSGNSEIERDSIYFRVLFFLFNLMSKHLTSR